MSQSLASRLLWASASGGKGIAAISPVSRSQSSSLGGVLRRSEPRRGGSHVYLGKHHDYNQWEILPPKKLQETGAIVPVASSPARPGLGKRVLRGTGLHGPENTNVFRLALWNRLKQRRPQREVPRVEEMREWNKLEVSCVWFTWGYLLFYWPMAMYGGHYAMHHDHYPWMPARTDGSLGDGPMFWYLE